MRLDSAAILRGLGGVSGCRALAEALYAGIARDPLLRPIFPAGSFHCAIEEFSAFLVQMLGGPAEHSQRRWWLSLRESHARFSFGPAERDAWLRQMAAALETVDIPQGVRRELEEFFVASSFYLIGEAADRPASLYLDAAVESIRRKDGETALRIASACPNHVLAGLLGLMVQSHDDGLIACARRQIRRQPDLIGERYAGRTLLHVAAAAGEVGTVELLLALGGDPNVEDAGAHAPLYSVANECGHSEGPHVVRALVRAGALVNAAGGVQRCTALHMAARRGHTAVAEALLECGADLHARDRSGATPLTRARNCRKREMAEFLERRAG